MTLQRFSVVCVQGCKYRDTSSARYCIAIIFQYRNRYRDTLSIKYRYYYCDTFRKKSSAILKLFDLDRSTQYLVSVLV